MRKKLRLGRLNSRILHPIQDLFRPFLVVENININLIFN